MSSSEDCVSSRPSSPVIDPESSPLRTELPSSPIISYESSPDENEDKDSSDESPPTKKKYAIGESQVSRSDLYWPKQHEWSSHSEAIVGDAAIDVTTEAHVSGLPHGEGQDWSANYDHLSDSSDGVSSISLSSSEAQSSESSSECESSDKSDTGSESSTNEGYESSSSEDSDHSRNSSISESCVLKVFEGSSLTVDEGVLHVMDLFVEQKLEKKTVGKILKTILKFIPEDNNMPQTQHSLFQYMEKLCPLPEEKVHFYCQKCQFYLGREYKECSLCDSKVCNKFYQLSLADQIKNLFENHNLAHYMDQYAAQRENEAHVEGVYLDVCDGSEYKRAAIPGKYNLLLLGHTDGVALTESGNASLSPLEYVILSLPPHLRFKYILVNGVWLDDVKPLFNTYYDPFAEELKLLNRVGVTWVHPKTGATETSYVTCPVFCADAPVRAQIQNILCHGGRHSCHLCEQKMLKLPAEPVLPGVQKKKRKRVFSFQEEAATIRTAERMKAQGEITLQRKINANGGKFVPKKGVLGRTVMSKVPKCDRSTVVYPEYMHLLIGIIKQFMVLWFESDAKANYSLKQHRDVINSFLLSIRVPDFLTRIPRSTECFSKWKANELRSFLLYFSPVILSQFMTEDYFKHWILFVCSLECLLRDRITESDLIRAELMLRIFVRNFSRLYRSEDMTYNLHNLLHLVLTVRRWGNLQFNSAFQFESFNGLLAKCIHGTKNQGKELINTVRLICAINVLRARVEHLEEGQSSKKVELRNHIKDYDLCEREEQLLAEFGTGVHLFSFFYRAVIDREVYTSCIYERQIKRNNYTICYINNSNNKIYGEIKCFVHCDGQQEVLAFVTPFRVDHMRTFTHEDCGLVVRHIIPIVMENRNNNVELIPVNSIVCKVIRVGEFVCLRPNTYEVNL